MGNGDIRERDEFAGISVTMGALPILFTGSLLLLLGLTSLKSRSIDDTLDYKIGLGQSKEVKSLFLSFKLNNLGSS